MDHIIKMISKEHRMVTELHLENDFFVTNELPSLLRKTKWRFLNKLTISKGYIGMSGLTQLLKMDLSYLKELNLSGNNLRQNDAQSISKMNLKWL